MILTKEEQFVFFDNFYPLLHYAAQYSRLIPKGISFDIFLKAPADLTIKSRDAIFKQKGLLKQYVSDNPALLKSLSPSFISGVEKGVFSEFIVLKQEKQFGVFMDRATGLFYHVTGLTGTFDSMLKFIPGYCKTALFNFNNRLVWDGLVIQKDRPVPAALEQVLLEKYSAVLKAKKVIELL